MSSLSFSPSPCASGLPFCSLPGAKKGLQSAFFFFFFVQSCLQLLSSKLNLLV